ncbi:MAG: glycosyltransferase [Bacilli bacterium]|jgi:glycosyltransferase involved in cell wall biosynthesis|nr:glycosyltransferase [Bacilli bacterium]
MKISFIIPIYNGANFIHRCLDSIVSQDYDNYEIIIINDGSIDNTKDILMQYLDNHSDILIKLFNTENRGHGSARNLGISQASGDYIWFVDIDDKLFDTDSLSSLVKELELYKPDIFITSVFETDFKKRNKYWHYARTDRLISIDDMPSLVFKQNWSWNKIINTNFLLNSGILFNIEKMFEDIYYIIPLYQLANKIYISRKVRYIYIKHADALTGKLSNFKSFPKAILFELKNYLKIKF